MPSRIYESSIYKKAKKQNKKVHTRVYVLAKKYIVCIVKIHRAESVYFSEIF
jgi:hypothetical protein